jgi:hypothetical protein
MEARRKVTEDGKWGERRGRERGVGEGMGEERRGMR